MIRDFDFIISEEKRTRIFDELLYKRANFGKARVGNMLSFETTMRM